ncbi:response regulator [Paenibacillus sp. TAF43_2]|uniref:response regulator n=1 Tax=Paenibacillus sp. TAF43_2 TaxID=3233069 RepID=UPI003F9561F6
MKLIHILIVEDDPLWQKSIYDHLIIVENFRIIGCASNENEALEQFQLADLVLIKLNPAKSKLDGIELSLKMNMIRPTKVIFITEKTDSETILDAYNAGALHCISKIDYRDLPHIIRTFSNKENSIEILLEDYAKLKKNAILQLLSPAEKEIFELLERGFTQVSIAQTLFKAESTVKNQVSSILKKMKVRNFKQALEKLQTIKCILIPYIF